MINFQYVIDSLETEEQRMTAEMIFENYKNMMYHTAYDVLRHREDAEDAVTASIIKLCLNMDLVFSVKPERVPGLVYTTVRNTAIDFYHSRQLRKTVSMNDEGIYIGFTRKPYHENNYTSYDNSDYTYEKTEIGDLDCVLMRHKEDEQDFMITWTDEGCIYVITAYLPIEELIKIVENVR